MLKKLRSVGIHLRSSLWFIPSLMAIGSIVLATLLIQAESLPAVQHLIQTYPFFSAGVEGSRSMLAAIATSMITVAGVSFSITLVSLSLASSQYTPRILRNFTRDRRNQLVLGVFVGVFTYCIVVLRAIRGAGDGAAFVPVLALHGALVLALVGVGFFIFFIHHITASIQASNILQSVTRETLAVMKEVFPKEQAHSPVNPAEINALLQRQNWTPLVAATSGYVQTIDFPEIRKVAEVEDVIVRVERGVGDFVVKATPLVFTNRPLPDKPRRRLRDSFTLGAYRTIELDPTFGIRQIVDIALKALSPSLNDTTTAVFCVDRLTEILATIAPRPVADRFRFDEGRLRVVAYELDFDNLVQYCFHEIRRSAASNVAVLDRILDGISIVASLCLQADRRETLITEVRLISQTAAQNLALADDRERIQNRARRVLRELLAEPVADRAPGENSNNGAAGPSLERRSLR